MSRALYHLSYGTAQAGRKTDALSGEDPILRIAPAPSACASSSVAWPATLAFSGSSLRQKNEEEQSTYGSAVGSRWLRRLDSNQRPSGNEPDELPLLHSALQVYRRACDRPRGLVGARGRRS